MIKQASILFEGVLSATFQWDMAKFPERKHEQLTSPSEYIIFGIINQFACGPTCAQCGPTCAQALIRPHVFCGFGEYIS